MAPKKKYTMGRDVEIKVLILCQQENNSQFINRSSISLSMKSGVEIKHMLIFIVNTVNFD